MVRMFKFILISSDSWINFFILTSSYKIVLFKKIYYNLKNPIKFYQTLDTIEMIHCHFFLHGVIFIRY